MIHKPIAAITKQDIDDLVSNAIRESRTMEYKQILPGNSNGEKYEFLADVSAFANAAGGDILYGISEKREQGQSSAMPDAAIGLAGIVTDAEIRRLHSLIRDGIEPRIPNVQIVAVEGFPSGPVLLLRVPKSWLSPHIISTRESRFYSRTDAGKYPLDISEIRSAFALSESLPGKIRRFRDDRIARIVADETPVRLSGPAKVILHLVPIASVQGTNQVEPAQLVEKYIVPLGSTGYNHRLNFDGLLNFDPVSQTPWCRSYVQVFRTGAFEAASGSLIGQRQGSQTHYISGDYLEEKVIAAFTAYKALLEEMQLQPPIFVMLTLVGVNGVRIYSGPSSDENEPIDRDVLFLPDFIVDSYDESPEKLLKPAFDALWQAGGFEQSPNYDANGNWRKLT